MSAFRRRLARLELMRNLEDGKNGQTWPNEMLVEFPFLSGKSMSELVHVNVVRSVEGTLLGLLLELQLAQIIRISKFEFSDPPEANDHPSFLFLIVVARGGSPSESSLCPSAHGHASLLFFVGFVSRALVRCL